MSTEQHPASTEQHLTIDHDASAQRFSTEVGGLRALLEYRLAGSEMTITHTEVPPALGGRGIAAELMRIALETAHTAGWTVIPACSYAAAYMRKRDAERADHAGDARQHGEDLLDEALEESFPASDPPSVGGVS